MAEPQKYPVPNKNYFAWNYEEQTNIKHSVLCAYSRIWLYKLGSRNNTLFFDCHGGCGAYLDEQQKINYGSTIIVNKIAQEINNKRGSKTGFIYCEASRDYYDNFKKVLSESQCSPIATFNQKFETILAAPNIKTKYQHNPTLFFIDPFGYDLDIRNLKDLLSTYGSEIIINFMFDFINRFIGKPELENCLNGFFGSNEWKHANNLSGIEREKYLVDLFKRNIKSITKAKYVFAYRLCYPNKNQTYYYLIHLTNHIDGITLMKSAFASINNGRVEYLGKNNNAPSLFDFTQIKADEMYKNVLKNLTYKQISFDNLWKNIVEDTAYTDKDLSNILQQLQKDGKVKVTRVSSKRGGFKKDDLILIGG